MMSQILIRRGRVVDPMVGRDAVTDVLIEDGVIRDVGDMDMPADRTIDAQGKIVAPGLIDMHVHLRQPGDEESETIQSGSAAALSGGYTTIACMPNTKPPLDNPKVIEAVRNEASRVNLVRVLPIGCVTVGRKGKELVSFESLMRAGAVAFSDDGEGVALAGVMEKALRQLRDLGSVVIEHAEVAKLSADGQVHDGTASRSLRMAGIPSASETEMVNRDLRLVARTKGRLHFAHLSTQEAVQAVRMAKREGIPVTAEVTPHHLLLDQKAVLSGNTSFKMKPPLRTQRDRKSLVGGVADGTIDVIATDHAPHSSQKKDSPFKEAPFGAIGIETSLGVLVDRLIHTRRITWTRLIAALTANPAKILGIDRGTLAVGSPADVVVIDPDRMWRIVPARFHSKSRNCPFAGWRVRGKAIIVISGGEIKYEEDQ
ncbi:MAG: dihydroorotase [Planctomycetota bacterium]